MAGTRITGLEKPGLEKPKFEKPGLIPKAPAEISRQTGITTAGPSSKTSAVYKEQFIQARELFGKTIKNLGLPKDALSVILLAFTRAFSISPNQALLTGLRREMLSLLKTLPEEGDGKPEKEAKTAMEAKALALIAAMDKGVILLPEAFERYAGLAIPPSFEEGASPQSGEEKQHEENDRDSLPAPEELEAIAEEEAKKDHLLNYMNSFPGKNGQHWLIFPFNLTIKGTELSVIIRLLIGEQKLIGSSLFAARDEQLIADIKSPRRQWQFYLKGKTGRFKADVRVFPPYSGKALKQIRLKAASFIGKSSGLKAGSGVIEEISVQNAEASWADELCAEYLPTINKSI